MLIRSFGAGNFATFWKYWNPIWGYYLGAYIFKPLKSLLPSAFALILTFGISGFIHDMVIMLIRWEYALIFTPWFLIMGIWIVTSELLKIDYSSHGWLVRAAINILIVGISFVLAFQLRP